MNEIIENLWVTDIETVREQPTQSFEYVITVCQDSVEDNVGCEYYHFNMADGPHNAYGGDASFDLFESAASTTILPVFLHQKTLVHCHHGQSRSTAVCIAVVGVLEDVPYGEAYNIVEEARPQTNPDPTLREHAKKFIEKYRV